jgi:uncharacterized protein YecT (DUF1311 family)
MKAPTVRALIILSFFLAMSSSARAQEKNDPCEKAERSGVTADLVECSSKKLAAADAELNKTYRQLIPRLNDKDWETKLRSAQQAWIKYRDANCDYESEFSGGGSATTFEYNFCLADMTTARTKQLREMLTKIKERDGN